ncbi:carotenoid oxygenase family protein [Actinomadura sp. 9N407]|uniref:carotenoid oxygenase family protein n=1 Tax=Actinomadura sp. 9N407 TaxID=3375154 RepID=UPI003798D2E7
MAFGAALPLLEEYDYDVREIEGTIPAGLSGTLYRVGPGKWQVGDTPLDCLLDGDGMVSRFVIQNGRVHFRNRYVRTPQYVHGLSSSDLKWRNLGTPAQRARLPWPVANTANTNVSFHAGDLLALWEGGKPYRLDPDSLETLGEHDFGGRLKGIGMWSAHPKFDPDTGEMFNFGTRLFPTPGLYCYKVSRQGRFQRIADLPIRRMPWNHDFALTAEHLVFFLDPIQPDPITLLRGTMLDALRYHPEHPTRVLLVPRDGSRPRMIEHEALVHLHMTNAYEDGSDTVVDFVEFDDFEWLKTSSRKFREPGALRTPPSRLMRYRITPSKIIRTELASFAADFPQFDWRRSTREHRFSYATGNPDAGAGGSFGSVIKIDNATGKVTSCDFRQGDLPGEAIFVPRTPDAAEDDGWLLLVGYDETEHRSRLVILDAADLERGPLAVARLPHHIPFGFHGGFTRRVARHGAP